MMRRMLNIRCSQASRKTAKSVMKLSSQRPAFSG